MNIDPKLVEQWAVDAWAAHPMLVESGKRLQHIAQRAADHALEEAIALITNYQIPVGNSAEEEFACDRTYAALVEVRASLRAMKGTK